MNGERESLWTTTMRGREIKQDRAEYIPRKDGNMINQCEVIWTRRKGVTRVQSVASYAWRWKWKRAIGKKQTKHTQGPRHKPSRRELWSKRWHVAGNLLSSYAHIHRARWNSASLTAIHPRVPMLRSTLVARSRKRSTALVWNREDKRTYSIAPGSF